jgi:hypothetical protein
VAPQQFVTPQAFEPDGSWGNMVGTGTAGRIDRPFAQFEYNVG